MSDTDLMSAGAGLISLLLVLIVYFCWVSSWKTLLARVTKLEIKVHRMSSKKKASKAR